MSDIYIYKQKAEKYKYKYLKLKQELYGGGSDGCTKNPPIFFNPDKFYTLNVNEEFDKLNDRNSIKGKILIKQDYPDIKTDINSFKNNNLYTGRLINHTDYKLLLQSLKDIEKTSEINLNYTTGIKYAYTINKVKQEKKGFFWGDYPNELGKKFSKCNIIGQPYNYGYIISDKPSKSLNDLLKSSEKLSPEDFNNLLNDLIIAIKEFIIPLHKTGYNLNNTSLDNIQWVDRIKICFDISALIKHEFSSINNNEIKKLIISISNLLKKIQKYNDNINSTDTSLTFTTLTLNKRKNFNNDFWYNTDFLNELLDSIQKDINKDTIDIS
jgi:hypothetical protein